MVLQSRRQENKEMTMKIAVDRKEMSCCVTFVSVLRGVYWVVNERVRLLYSFLQVTNLVLLCSFSTASSARLAFG